MSKSIKLNNDIYWDASSIAYNNGSETITDIKSYIDAMYGYPIKVRTYTTTSRTCAGSSNVEIKEALPASVIEAGYTPVIMGWEVVGSTTTIASYFHVYSVYISKNGTLQFFVKNRNTSSRSFQARVVLIYLKTNLIETAD